MRAKFIYEKFTEHSDPIEDMRIGSFEKKINFTSKDNLVDTLAGLIPRILEIDEIPEDIINTDRYLILPHYYNTVSHYIYRYFTYNDKPATEDTTQWALRLRKKLREMGFQHPENARSDTYKIDEKFSEQSDPIDDMGIGLVEKIRRALIQITKDQKMIYFLGTPIVKQFALSKSRLIGYTAISISDNAPYIEKIFTENGIADYVIFNPPNDNTNAEYYFMLKIKPGYYNAFKKAIEKMNVNEKFTEKSDPIADLGIGLQNKRFSVIGNKMFDNKWGEYDNVKKLLKEYLNTSVKNIYLLAKTKKRYIDEKNPLINYINKLNKKAKFGEKIISRVELDQVATSNWFIFTQIETDLGIVVEAHDTATYSDERTYWADEKTFVKYLDKFSNNISVNEKFVEKSDPLDDMGIGIEGYRNQMKRYNLRAVFPSMLGSFKKHLEQGFGTSWEEIYHLSTDTFDPDYEDQYDRDMKNTNQWIRDEIKKSKKIYEFAAPVDDGYAVRVFDTTIGKIGSFHSYSSYAITYVGDLHAILKIKAII